MTDREKMIEVMREFGIIVDAGAIADRLIEAGFVHGSRIWHCFERVGVYMWSGGFKSDDEAVIENGEALYKVKQ